MYTLCCGSNAVKIPCQIIHLYISSPLNRSVYILQNFNKIFNKA